MVDEGPKGCLPQRNFPAASGRGAGDPQTCPNFAYGKWLYPYRMLLHGASDLDQRCLQTCNSKDGCTFTPNIFAPTPKITPKPHFGGPFNAKPIIQIALSKSHVNGATKVKLLTLQLYRFCISKYLGMYQNFSVRGVRGRRAP